MSILIETPRLLIREITEDDFPDLFRLDSDPRVQKYTGQLPVETEEELANIYRTRVFTDYKKHGFGRWAVVLKSTNQLTGWVGLKYLPEFDEVDHGYRLLPEFWGMGIATEASIPIVKYGFEQLGLKKIIAIALPENTASINIMKKLGMTHYDTKPYEEGTQEAVWYKLEKEEI